MEDDKNDYCPKCGHWLIGAARCSACEPGEDWSDAYREQQDDDRESYISNNEPVGGY